MRTIFLSLLTATTFFAQAQKISGIAKDENGSPLIGATISLHKASDSAVLKLAVSKENGAYTFSGINEGKYKVSASNVGYKTVFSETFTITSSDITVLELRLSKIATSLSNVTVTSTKPMVEVKADKTILKDRKSTRLNSSHSQISYAVFCLKKKK